jgi:hypothetical protein
MQDNSPKTALWMFKSGLLLGSFIFVLLVAVTAAYPPLGYYLAAPADGLASGRISKNKHPPSKPFQSGVFAGYSVKACVFSGSGGPRASARCQDWTDNAIAPISQ